MHLSVSALHNKISKSRIGCIGRLGSTVMEFGANFPEQIIPIKIYFHKACTEHYIHSHPEAPGRVGSILRSLHKEWPQKYFHEAPLCEDDQILQFHTHAHLSYINQLCTRAEEAKQQGALGRNDKIQMIDADTAIMANTREAAYRAAGSVVAAVDDVFNSRARSVFCCVRPPGHHAERNRAMGFCFFNNAAIGALYAKTKYNIKKVAVLDFDVHHGNGTEEGFSSNPDLFYGSTHQRDAYPGTGSEPDPDAQPSEIQHRIVNRFLDAGPQSRPEFHKKWLEILEVMEKFQPGLVIISAGFDAHDEDPLASCELTEEDFSWATEQILISCSNISTENPPPCISVLEGGYDLDALASSAAAHVRALAKGPPAIAVSHNSPLLPLLSTVATLEESDIKDLAETLAEVKIGETTGSI